VQNLLDDLDGFVAAPDGQQKEKLAELTPLVNDALAQAKKIAEEELPALNKKMNDAGIPTSSRRRRSHAAGGAAQRSWSRSPDSRLGVHETLPHVWRLMAGKGCVHRQADWQGPADP